MSVEGKRLAEVVKATHKRLRKRYKHESDESSIWSEHVQKCDELQQYSQAMKTLATDHWKQYSESGSRVHWIYEAIKQYYYEGGMQKAMDKEMRKLSHLNLTPDINIPVCNTQNEPAGKLKVLDVGSCYNPFSVYEELDVTAIDLCPASETVFKGDFLNIQVVPNNEEKIEKEEQEKNTVENTTENTTEINIGLNTIENTTENTVQSKCTLENDTENTTENTTNITENTKENTSENNIGLNTSENTIENIHDNNMGRNTIENTMENNINRPTTENTIENTIENNINRPTTENTTENNINRPTTENTTENNINRPTTENAIENIHENNIGLNTIENIHVDNIGLNTIENTMESNVNRPTTENTIENTENTTENKIQLKNPESRIQNESKNITSLKAQYYDVIIFSFLIEYIPFPKQRLKMCVKAYELLKPNGILCIVTPDSKHKTANVILYKLWKISLTFHGFVRIKYEKSTHFHGMVFRKGICKDVWRQDGGRELLAVQKSKLPAKFSNIDFENVKMEMYIPQDFNIEDF